MNAQTPPEYDESMNKALSELANKVHGQQHTSTNWVKKPFQRLGLLSIRHKRLQEASTMLFAKVSTFFLDADTGTY